MWKWILVTCIACSAILDAETNVLAFAGSARQDSVNKKLISEAAATARQMGANVTVIDLKDFQTPFFSEDIERNEGMPAKARKLRQLMMKSQVIIIASPEYNGSLSGLLKNTIDWASRNENGGPSQDAFKGKKFVIMSASPGSGGGIRGLEHLRTILQDIGGNVLPQQIVVPDAYTAFDEQGKLKNKQLKLDMQQALQKALN